MDVTPFPINQPVRHRVTGRVGEIARIDRKSGGDCWPISGSELTYTIRWHDDRPFNPEASVSPSLLEPIEN